MGTFTILRKQFPDRVIDTAELAAMTDMLREWYQAKVGGGSGAAAQCWCEARIYSVPRAQLQGVHTALSSRLPGASIDTSDPDVLTVSGAGVPVSHSADLTVWQEVLAAPQAQSACVMLRFAIGAGSGRSREKTIVFYGTPAATGGAMLVKAIWPVGADPAMELVHRAAVWDLEQRFLGAFEHYRRETSGRSNPSNAAAGVSSQFLFAREGPGLFVSAGHERAAMWMVRQWIELPDDHSPLALLRRLIPPLLGAAVFIAAVLLLHPTGFIAEVCVLLAAVMLFWAGVILWRKWQRISRHYHAMRQGLGKLYSGPIAPQQVDLSADPSPTRIKYSSDVEALGARHIGDISITTAKSVLDGNRYYALGDATIALGLLRKTEHFVFFPAKPILLVTTRFQDGSRHFTANHAIYRKPRRKEVTGRCQVDDTAGLDQLLALHRKYVDRLIAAGRVPKPLPASAQEVIDRMYADHEEGRESWMKRPFSWGDAMHEGFKVCRREYRAD